MPEFERYFLEGSNGLTWYPLPEIEVGIEMELKRIVRELKLKSPTRDKGPQSPRPTHLLNWLMSEFLSASRSARNRRIVRGKRLAEIRQRSADPIFFGKGDAEDPPSVVDPPVPPAKSLVKGHRGQVKAREDGSEGEDPAPVKHNRPRQRS